MSSDGIVFKYSNYYNKLGVAIWFTQLVFGFVVTLA